MSKELDKSLGLITWAGIGTCALGPYYKARVAERLKLDILGLSCGKEYTFPLKERG